VGLLDGDIANIVAGALVGAGMFKEATLIKVAPGTRTPGAIASGTNPTTTSYGCQGIPASTTALRLSGTLISGVDRVIKIFGATLPAGITPQPGDRITMDGSTSTIVGDAGGQSAVAVDPAGACFTCQCRT
jgi:hypothetical protein